jgi:pimeloyl-ACP methyl ester carboxylesterase
MRVPTLVVLAEQSRAHDVGKVRMNAETRLPYVSVVVLAGASHHSIPTTSPDQLNRELVQFLVREEL